MSFPGRAGVSGGLLQLVARRTSTLGHDAQGGQKEYACRSGMVTTYPGFRFKYGYLLVQARIPDGVGLWPALWLAAANLRWPPEMDLLEHWGAGLRTGVYFHPVGVPPVIQHLHVPNLSSQWHTFGLSWTPSRLVWFIDGKPVLAVDKHIPHQAMYFIANLAEATPPGAGSGCHGTMLVRSVKVWQH